MDYVALKAELTAGHPDTGAYNVDDALAADQLNAVNRSATNVIGEMLKYLINKKHRTNNGSDTTYTPIVGRLHHNARSNSGDNPFSKTAVLNLAQVHACQAFVTLFESQHLEDLDFDDANLPYGFVEASGAWATTHTTALKALSQSQQSRAAELGFGLVTVGDVTFARAQ